jgi:hypothetical protein
VATAAGVAVTLIPGSIEDAARLLGTQPPRVTYLDLRGATVAQALDWILQPARLRWQPSQDGVAAGSDRRGAAESAWIYDVSPIALPSAEELQSAKDEQPQIEAVQKAATEFLTAVRRELKLQGETTAAWFAPGQLLVIGNAEKHAAAQDLFDELATEPTAESKRLAELRAVTSRRAAQNRPAAEKRQAARRLLDVAHAHREFGWQLLAAAANGRLDVEALTELQVAWRSAQTDRLLTEQGAGLALRSLWIVAESARALPECAELQALAKSAQEKCRPAFARVMGALEKTPDNSDAILTVVYGMLALRDDAELRTKAIDLMARAAGNQPELAPIVTVAKSLQADLTQIDRVALEKAISSESNEITGDDLVVLTALAARRAGGDTWQAFRARMRELLADQPLSGHVVVLLNRLAKPALPLATGRA